MDQNPIAKGFFYYDFKNPLLLTRGNTPLNLKIKNQIARRQTANRLRALGDEGV